MGEARLFERQVYTTNDTNALPGDHPSLLLVRVMYPSHQLIGGD
jgi:hypothetical protein